MPAHTGEPERFAEFVSILERKVEKNRQPLPLDPRLGAHKMDQWEFLKWRRTLHLTQVEAGERLGVHRATIKNWERGCTPIPKIIELACPELTRRWRQRSEFGPVLLIYLERCGENILGFSDPIVALRCSQHATNDAALKSAVNLEKGARPLFIIGITGDLIWNTEELGRVCEERKKNKSESPDSSVISLRASRINRP